MPSVSKKQHNLMAAVAKNPAFAKKVGIKQSVGEEFIEADKSKKFGTGGDVNYTYGGKGQINKQRTRGGSIYGVQKNVPNINLDKYEGKKKGGEIMDKKDLAQDKKIVKKAVGLHDKQMHGGKKTNLSTLKKGGMTFGGKETKAEEARERKAAPTKAAYKKAEMKFEGEAMKRGGCTTKKMAGGGLAAGHKSADGIATKGKTKARAVTMKKGGKC